MNSPILTTPRCLISLLRVNDAPLLQAYVERNRAHLAQWELTRDADYFTLAACEQRISKMEETAAAGSGYTFAVFTPDRQHLIALCSASNIVRGVFQACHLGYSIDAAYEGKGLMRESLQAIITYLFDGLRLHRVMANYLPHNERSGRLLERLGFEKEGYAKAYLKINGEWQDHVLTSLINPNPI